MELKDTVEMMLSADYKERFKAEYFQTKIRHDKLREVTIKAEAETLDFKPTCPLYLLKAQLKDMSAYLYALETRAEIEGISLEGESV